MCKHFHVRLETLRTDYRPSIIHALPRTTPSMWVLVCVLTRSVMSNAGTALMGIGSGEGKTKAEDAANAAIASPLLDSPIDKAKGIVFNIIGGNDMSLQEVCFGLRKYRWMAGLHSRRALSWPHPDGWFHTRLTREPNKQSVLFTGFQIHSSRAMCIGRRR